MKSVQEKVSLPMAKPRRGRPPKEDSKDKINLTLRMYKQFYAEVRRYADEHDSYISDIVTIAVTEYMAANGSLSAV